MWSKEESENWIFNKLEFAETVFIEYFKILFGIWFHPRRTLELIKNNEIISPLVFFILNLFLTGILESLVILL